ncbi:MAG: hypothetical protein QXS40_02150, partial [Candidatus Nitrosocaldus sp.]
MRSSTLAMAAVVALMLVLTVTEQLAFAAHGREVKPNDNGSIPFVEPDQNPHECWTPEGEPCPIDRGDTAWMLTASALVLFMTPGVAFFYGGLARSKNVVSTIGMCFIVIGIISVQWVLYGYSLA